MDPRIGSKHSQISQSNYYWRQGDQESAADVISKHCGAYRV
jgi:hypothetical protein